MTDQLAPEDPAVCRLVYPGHEDGIQFEAVLLVVGVSDDAPPAIADRNNEVAGILRARRALPIASSLALVADAPELSAAIKLAVAASEPGAAMVPCEQAVRVAERLGGEGWSVAVYLVRTGEPRPRKAVTT